MMVVVGIIDYGAGNLRSISKACEHLKAKVRIASKPKALEDVDAIILPGVGNFGDSMKSLWKFRKTLASRIDDGVPFLGLCLGVQVLFEESEESPGVKGLGLLEGECVRLPEKKVKIPHMGWNTVEKTKDTPLLKGVKSGNFFYFVHSYYAVPEDRKIIAGETDYGVRFPSVIAAKENIYATQFHPEKSGETGLRILENFLSTCGK
jgi:glutamine amidotransferase